MNIKKYSCSTPPFVEIFICKYLLFKQTLKNSNLHVSFTCFFACSNTHGTLLSEGHLLEEKANLEIINLYSFCCSSTLKSHLLSK